MVTILCTLIQSERILLQIENKYIYIYILIRISDIIYTLKLHFILALCSTISYIFSIDDHRADGYYRESRYNVYLYLENAQIYIMIYGKKKKQIICINNNNGRMKSRWFIPRIIPPIVMSEAMRLGTEEKIVECSLKVIRSASNIFFFTASETGENSAIFHRIRGESTKTPGNLSEYKYLRPRKGS